MDLKRYIVITLVVVYALCSQAKDYRVDFYNRWDTMATKTLMEKGAAFMGVAGKTDSATVCFSVVVNRYQRKRLSKDELPMGIKAMSMLGYLYQYEYFDYSKSYAYLQQALSLSEDIGFTASLPRIYLNMGTLFYASYMQQGDEKKAYGTMDYLKKAFHAAQREKAYSVMLNSFSDMLNLVFFMGDVKDVTAEIAAFKRQQFPKGTMHVTFMRSLCEMVEADGRGDIEGALRAVDGMKTHIEGTDTVRYLLMVYTDRAALLNKAGRKHEAMACVREKLRMAQACGVKDILVDAYKDIFTIYKDLGDGDTAAHYELMYLRQRDSLMSQSQLNKVEEYSFLYQLKKINEQVDDMTRKHERQQTVLVAVIAVAVVVALCLLLVVYNYRRLRETNRRLYEKNKELLLKEEEERQTREQNERLKEDLDAAEQGKYRGSSIDEQDKERILNRIRKVMESSAEIFSEDFSLVRLAELTQTHQRYVSQVLNEQDGMNFKTMLNDYRIKESCRRMSGGGEYANYSIESIAESVGFKSRTYFSSLFKRITGLTPSEYQRQASLDKTL